MCIHTNISIGFHIPGLAQSRLQYGEITVFWMNLWGNCVDVIWWKSGSTSSVTFLTVSASHFHRIVVNYIGQHPQFCRLVAHFHDFLSSAHMTLTVQSVWSVGLWMLLEQSSCGANFMMIEPQENVSLIVIGLDYITGRWGWVILLQNLLSLGLCRTKVWCKIKMVNRQLLPVYLKNKQLC